MNTAQTISPPGTEVYENLTIVMGFIQHMSSIAKSIDALAEKPDEGRAIRDLTKLCQYLAEDAHNMIDVELERLYGTAYLRQMRGREEAA